MDGCCLAWLEEGVALLGCDSAGVALRRSFTHDEPSLSSLRPLTSATEPSLLLPFFNRYYSLSLLSSKQQSSFVIPPAPELFYSMSNAIALHGAALIGLLVIAKYVLTFLKGIYARCLRPGKDLKKKYGQWGKEALLSNRLYNIDYNTDF